MADPRLASIVRQVYKLAALQQTLEVSDASLARAIHPTTRRVRFRSLGAPAWTPSSCRRPDSRGL